jgi:hypothetical protein
LGHLLGHQGALKDHPWYEIVVVRFPARAALKGVVVTEEPVVKGVEGVLRLGLRSIYKISDRTLLLFRMMGRTA